MRIRTIKPEFFTHEGLYELEKSTKLPIRVAFAGLWCAADREGRFKWEVRRLGVSILPYDSCDFSRVLDALLTRGFIRQYRVGDAYYGVIPSFTKHQIVNNRERLSDLPEPPKDQYVDASVTRESTGDPRDWHATSVEGKGKEQGKERNKEGVASLTLPADLDTALFREAWANFIEHRRQKRKPLTGMAAEMQIKSLLEIGERRAVIAINHSIKQGWQGIFEPGHVNGSAKPSGQYPENIPMPDLTPNYDEPEEPAQ